MNCLMTLLLSFFATLALAWGANVTDKGESNQCYVTYTECLNQTKTQKTQQPQNNVVISSVEVIETQGSKENVNDDKIKLINNEDQREEKQSAANERQLEAMSAMMTMMEKVNGNMKNLTELMLDVPHLLFAMMQGFHKQKDFRETYFFMKSSDLKRVYIYAKLRKNFYKAREYCEDRKAFLSKLETKKESQMVIDFIRDSDDVADIDMYWVDGTDLKKENRWVWGKDGTPFTYKNFNSGEPNGHKKENCLDLLGKHYFEWNDEGCGRRGGVICEKEIDKLHELPSDWIDVIAGLKDYQYKGHPNSKGKKEKLANSKDSETSTVAPKSHGTTADSRGTGQTKQKKKTKVNLTGRWKQWMQNKGY